MHRFVPTLCLVASLLHGPLAADDDQPDRTELPATVLHYRVHGEVFVNSVNIVEHVPETDYTVCGFGRGFLSLMEWPNGKRLVYFQVVEEPPFGVRGKDSRVKLLFSDADVELIRANDGTPKRYCFLEFDWMKGKTYHFAVSVVVRGDRSEYTGWFHNPRKKSWRRLATYSTLTGGRVVDNRNVIVQGGKKGVATTDVCRARFGPSWVRVDGQWEPDRKARFETVPKRAKNVDASPSEEGFLLVAGGDTRNATTKVGDEVAVEVRKRPANLLDSLDALLP